MSKKKTIIAYALVRFITLFSLIATMYIWSDNANKVNGNPDLWNRRYNQVAYAATHNGQSHLLSAVQNQNMSLTEQLKNGIRATKIHVWYDQTPDKKVMPHACHGVTKDMLEGAYLEKIVEKLPRLFQGYARNALKQIEPINELVKTACDVAYGSGAEPGVVQFKHCILDPARRPLRELLAEIKKFLDENPQEVLTIILEDHTNSLEHLANDFTASKLDKYAHTQDITALWPTLGQMVTSNKRLVILVHGDAQLPYKKYPWMHYMWDYAWDTEWDFNDANELKDKDAMPKRGLDAYKQRNTGVKNKLFIVHHFLTPMAGGTKDGAKKINKKVVLQARLDKLTKKSGQIPNIVQVDFFEYPNNDIFEVIDSLNKQSI